MRAGDWTEIVEEYSAAPRGLKLYDHMNVVFETWDSTKPRNCYGGVQKMSSLTGGRVGKATYSNWAMRTAANGCVTSAPMWS